MTRCGARSQSFTAVTGWTPKIVSACLRSVSHGASIPSMNPRRNVMHVTPSGTSSSPRTHRPASTPSLNLTVKPMGGGAVTGAGNLTWWRIILAHLSRPLSSHHSGKARRGASSAGASRMARIRASRSDMDRLRGPARLQIGNKPGVLGRTESPLKRGQNPGRVPAEGRRDIKPQSREHLALDEPVGARVQRDERAGAEGEPIEGVVQGPPDNGLAAAGRGVGPARRTEVEAGTARRHFHH